MIYENLNFALKSCFQNTISVIIFCSKIMFYKHNFSVTVNKFYTKNVFWK